jgi:hypothetical protein
MQDQYFMWMIATEHQQALREEARIESLMRSVRPTRPSQWRRVVGGVAAALDSLWCRVKHVSLATECAPSAAM